MPSICCLQKDKRFPRDGVSRGERKKNGRRETLDSRDYTWTQLFITYLVCISIKAFTQILHFTVSFRYIGLLFSIQKQWKRVNRYWLSFRILYLEEEIISTKGSLMLIPRINVQVLWSNSRSFIASSYTIRGAILVGVTGDGGFTSSFTTRSINKWRIT